jgi:hypothetical protein
MSVRRSASLAVAAIGFVTLAACSSSSSSSGSPGSAASSPAKLKSIFFANPLPDYPDWATADKCFESETAKLGVKGVTQGPTGLQVNDQFVLDRISQAIAQKYNALIAVPITVGVQPLFQRARAREWRSRRSTPARRPRTRTWRWAPTTAPRAPGGGEHRHATRAAECQDHHQRARRIGDVIINAFKSHLPPT